MFSRHSRTALSVMRCRNAGALVSLAIAGRSELGRRMRPTAERRQQLRPGGMPCIRGGAAFAELATPRRPFIADIRKRSAGEALISWSFGSRAPATRAPQDRLAP